MTQTAAKPQGDQKSEPSSSAETDWALGPGSVSWEVMRDPTVFIVGLLREALLLALHPPFAAAAVDHDSFGDDPVMRFRHVAIYTYGATYGTKADAERVSAMVRRTHTRIVGVEPLTSIPYRAHSEYELALTSAMLTASFLATYEEIHGELLSTRRDQFVQEQKVPAALLGIHPEHLPSSYGELVDFVAHARQKFATGLQAREIIAPFADAEYPAGTVIGDLSGGKRKLAMFAARTIADMAILTMSSEEQSLLSINRRPKLGSRSLSRKALHLFSRYMRSEKGEQMFDSFLKSNTAGIFRAALKVDDARGGRTRIATFEVPDASLFVVDVPDMVHNWPGSTDSYLLGGDRRPNNLELTEGMIPEKFRRAKTAS